MATTINRFSCTALRHTSRIPSRRKRMPSAQFILQIHTSPLHHTEDNPSEPSKSTRKPFKFSYFDLPPSERQQWKAEAKQMHDYMTSPSTKSELSNDVAQAIYETAEESPHVPLNIPRIKPGLFAMGEMEPQESGEDEEFEGDDITSLGHAHLEQHREMREYARIAAWEMPLLSSTHHLPLPQSTSSPIHLPPTDTLLSQTRTRQTLRTPTINPPPPLPLHNLHGRNAPRLQKNRP